jgi:AbrB family looped-hinge helix DNA binding protein
MVNFITTKKRYINQRVNYAIMRDIDIISEIDKQGRLVIPANIRKLLNLDEGDFIKLRFVEKIKREED